MRVMAFPIAFVENTFATILVMIGGFSKGMSVIWSVGCSIDGISAAWTNALFGHATTPERRLIPSGLNYFLDFAYNFDFLGLLPLVALALYSLAVVCWLLRAFWALKPICGSDPGGPVHAGARHHLQRRPAPTILWRHHVLFLGLVAGVISLPGMRLSSVMEMQSEGLCAGIF
jgi:hypothetical protein